MDGLTRFSWVLVPLGALSLVAAGFSYLVWGELDPTARGLAAGGGVALLAWAFLDRQRVETTVTSRAFGYGSGASLLVALAGTLSVGSYLLVRDRDHTWDWTQKGTFTLSDQSRTVLASLNEPVQVLAFFRDASEGQRQFRDLIRQATEQTAQLQVEWVDPLANPRRAEEAGVKTEAGVVLFRLADGTERRLEGVPTETKLIQQLVLLRSRQDHALCWVTGHGEGSPDDEVSPRGYGLAAFEIGDLNYDIRPVRTATEGIPATCEVLVVAGPGVDWLPAEREALVAFVAGGGRALVLSDPGQAPELAADLERFGVELAEDLVLDVDPQNQLLGVDEPTYVVLSGKSLLPHPITRNLSAALVLGIARSVVPAEGAAGLVVRPLLETSVDAWAETNFSDGLFQQDEGERLGPLPLAVVVEVQDPAVLEVAAPVSAPALAPPADGGEVGAPPVEARPDAAPTVVAGRAAGVPAGFVAKPGGRVVLVGDSDFGTNALIHLGNNRDLLLNALAWLADEPDQIGERPEGAETLELTAGTGLGLGLVSSFLVPGLAAMGALVAFFRRRLL